MQIVSGIRNHLLVSIFMEDFAYLGEKVVNEPWAIFKSSQGISLPIPIEYYCASNTLII